MSRVSPQFLSQDILNAQQVRDQQFRFINIIPAFQDNESVRARARAITSTFHLI